MNLFDEKIVEIQEALKKMPGKVTAYDLNKAWPDAGTPEFVLLRDSAFELGGNGKKSVNCTCVTSTPNLVTANEIQVIGPDLKDIRGDVSFARIAFLDIDDPGEDEKAYDVIKQLEYVRYNIHPRGYISRTSSESNREEVRVSKAAVAHGISFEKVGNAYIRKYLQMPGVHHVRVIFAVDFTEIDTLIREAGQVSDITRTLKKILAGLPNNCAECQLKQVCDSVEGLREMHMKQRERDRRFLNNGRE